VVVRSPDLGGCLCGDCLGPGLLRNGRVGRNAVVVSTETKTRRVHRTWLERLKLWRHAYETKVFKNRHEAIGRGSTPEASQKAIVVLCVKNGLSPL
jgi:hypothetical protein